MRALALLLVLCSAGPAAALIAGTQCRAVPSLVARPSARCCAAEEAVVEEAPEEGPPPSPGAGARSDGVLSSADQASPPPLEAPYSGDGSVDSHGLRRTRKPAADSVQPGGGEGGRET